MPFPCPRCGEDAHVKDVRDIANDTVTYRKRQCISCKFSFKTYESEESAANLHLPISENPDRDPKLTRQIVLLRLRGKRLRDIGRLVGLTHERCRQRIEMFIKENSLG